MSTIYILPDGYLAVCVALGPLSFFGERRGPVRLSPSRQRIDRQSHHGNKSDPSLILHTVMPVRDTGHRLSGGRAGGHGDSYSEHVRHRQHHLCLVLPGQGQVPSAFLLALAEVCMRVPRRRIFSRYMMVEMFLLLQILLSIKRVRYWGGV